MEGDLIKMAKRTDQQLTESVKISPRLKKYLLDRATKRETYEDVIWRLIGQKQITKEDADQLPPNYVPKLNSGKRKR